MFLDITGHRYGRLVALRRDGKMHGKTAWLCKCDCGKEKLVTATHLKTGHTTSCGCRLSELNTEIATLRKTHGKSGSPEFCSWSGMIGRCMNKNNKRYARYGGRGIIVCERWLGSFSDFLADMGPKPSPLHQIDRIDVDGDYDQGNCRWVLPKEQQQNRSNNKWVRFNGRTISIGECASILRIHHGTLRHRLRSMPFDMAMTPGQIKTKRKMIRQAEQPSAAPPSVKLEIPK